MSSCEKMWEVMRVEAMRESSSCEMTCWVKVKVAMVKRKLQ